MLRLCEGNLKKGQKHPLVSSLGVNQDINNVNTKHYPFISSLGTDFLINLVSLTNCLLKLEKSLRRGLGVSMLTNLLVNNSQRISS